MATHIPTPVPTDAPAASVPSTTTRVRTEITLPVELATSVQISSVVPLREVVPGALPVAAELSPDGSRVAWLVPEQGRREAMVCVARLDEEVEQCYPASGYRGLPYRLAWSPDGRWLAFTEDPSAQALESDLWLLDTVAGEVVNRTDDGVVGRAAEVEGQLTLDYLPVWDPATGYLYFFRSVSAENAKFALALMRLDPDQAEAPVTVRSLGQELGDGLVRFGWQRFYLEGPAAIAPDGSQLAVVIAPAQEMDISTQDALWLLDLVDHQAAPRQIATSVDWQQALPAWSNQPAVARGLAWTNDAQGIVVAALSSDLRLPLLVSYYVEVASGNVTPVVDFSDSQERNAFFRIDPATGEAPRFGAPWTVALAPDANVLLMVTDLGGVVRVLGAPLPPTGDAPVVLHEQRSPGYEVWTRSSRAQRSVLVYGLLLELTPR